MTREELIEVIRNALWRQMFARDENAETIEYQKQVWDDDWERTLPKAKAMLSALEAAGVRLVPAQLDSKNLDHWKIASAGINAIEDFGGQFGSDHTPERQIADVYRDMVQLAASPYAPQKEQTHESD